MRVTILITLVVALCFSSQAFAAATVFFKDGTKEVGTSVWVDGTTVYLNKSNELYEFSSDEVNMDETSRFNRIGSHADQAVPDVQPRRGTAVGRDATSKEKPRYKPAARREETSALNNSSAERPFFGVRMPDDSTPCSSGLQAELMERFVKYNRAAEAGEFREFEKHIIAYQAEASRKALAGLSKKELQERRKILLGLASKNYHSTACLVSNDGTLAALAGRGIVDNKDSHGSFLFRKEGQVWKVQSSVWNKSL
jgi:hypothetical protein